MTLHETKYQRIDSTKSLILEEWSEGKLFLKITEQSSCVVRSVGFPISFDDLFMIAAKLNGAVDNLQHKKPIE